MIEHDFTEYETSRTENKLKVQAKFSDAISALKEFDECFSDGDNVTGLISNKFITEFIDNGLPLKFHQYHYDDTYYRCGDIAGGEETHLVAILDETQIKSLMREFYLKNPKDFCRHKFLRSLDKYGIIINGTCDLYGDLLSYQSIDLGEITEADICSAEEYSKIITERKRLEEERIAKARAEAETKEKQRRKQMYEQLKQEFENK